MSPPEPAAVRRQPRRLLALKSGWLRGGRAAGAPVLLSVAYAACHWCQAMAHR
ncbi:MULTISPECIES: DUF255 domain-containing protein [unclassified Kitasatospora]|uniref:DUF255 domain-containing protein n=1 Tax=Kitasatospora sp. NPDC001261 TaxID=3364012 RepID=UPI0036AA75A4